ncbi:hypothetical protein FRB96_006943 [Tulasnella sp. 330]|nr:hypothetical protein FRB96_006943 [Tulasnella sp. 330]KAG8876555.1 hypothetical protein FRB97_004108 [Tulasnella sp. 331]KAG8889835.1 hypothetical protein FRB98_002484 [Tulasnella sp. 332]
MISSNSDSEKATTKVTPSESNNMDIEYVPPGISPDDPPEAGPSTQAAQAPPSYDGSNYPPPPNISATRRVNHICIKEQREDIKGEWTIDPNIRVPSSLVDQIQQAEAGANLVLESKNGSVAGKVRLISDKPSKSIIHASSDAGSVVMKFPQRLNQRFYLKAHSRNGSVTARIPPDFEGPVTFNTKNGSLKFSGRIQKSLIHFNRSEKAGKAFIGSRGALGNDDPEEDGEEAWDGDELVLSSERGNIRLEYADEPSEFKKVKDDFKDTGPISGVVNYTMRKILERSSSSYSR